MGTTHQPRQPQRRNIPHMFGVWFILKSQKEVVSASPCDLSALVDRSRRLSWSSAAASALFISTSRFGPTWRITDGNTDDSPKDRLDLYDGKKQSSGCSAAACAPRVGPVPGLRSLDARLASLLACSLTSRDNMRITHGLWKLRSGSLAAPVSWLCETTEWQYAPPKRARHFTSQVRFACLFVYSERAGLTNGLTS